MVSHQLKREFVIANQRAEFFKGICGGNMVFTNIFNEAKPLVNIECIPTVKRQCPGEVLEIIYLDTFN